MGKALHLCKKVVKNQARPNVLAVKQCASLARACPPSVPRARALLDARLGAAARTLLTPRLAVRLTARLSCTARGRLLAACAERAETEAALEAFKLLKVSAPLDAPCAPHSFVCFVVAA